MKKKTKKKETKQVVEIHIYVHQVPIYNYPNPTINPNGTGNPIINPNGTGNPIINPPYIVTC